MTGALVGFSKKNCSIYQSIHPCVFRIEIVFEKCGNDISVWNIIVFVRDGQKSHKKRLIQIKINILPMPNKNKYPSDVEYIDKLGKP